MVIAVVNIMLPRLAVLKIYCLQASFCVVFLFLLEYLSCRDRLPAGFHYLMTSLPDYNRYQTSLLSHANDFILYCTDLSNESFLENEFFSKKLEWKSVL